MADTTARAKRRIAAVTYRLQRDVPLLLHAGVVSVPTLAEANDYLAQADADRQLHWTAMEEAGRHACERASWMRSQVADLVTPDALALLDAQRLFYPSEPGYSSDFWRTKLRELGKDLP